LLLYNSNPDEPWYYAVFVDVDFCDDEELVLDVTNVVAFKIEDDVLELEESLFEV